MMIRKILAVLISAVMVLSMIPVMAVTTSAVDVEGDWVTCRSANDYDEEQENGSYKPAPGYHYTADGFETIGADYTNTMPYFHVMSRETQSLKDGIYMEVRVDDFDYNGWLSFTIWDSENFSILDTGGFGSGWSSLVNGNGTGGTASVGSNIVLEDGNDLGENAFMNSLGNVNVTPELKDGKEVYTLEVNYDGSQYNILVCGVLVAGSTEITTLFNKLNANGEFYIGLAMFSATTGGTAGLSILKYGTDKASASTPVGTDSAEPEPNANVFADMMPADSVEAGMPAFTYDASLYSIPQVANATASALGDNAFRFTSRVEDMYFRWIVKNTISYDAADFPVVAFMLRSYDASGGAVYYCSGDQMSANAEYMTSWGLWDEGCLEYEDADGVYYNMVVVDLTGQWEDRINLIRFDFFDIDVSDEDDATFDFCWAGTFRSVEEAQTYTRAWASEKGLGDIEEDTTEAPTEAPTEVPTEAETKAEVKTEAPAVTEAPETPEKKGCGAVMSTAAVLLTAAAAAVCLKRKED